MILCSSTLSECQCMWYIWSFSGVCGVELLQGQLSRVPAYCLSYEINGIVPQPHYFYLRR